ncbi:unnamed protein product [Rotaria sp. Silwood1]|nr:unnamed protein product [Rotaria sp. Silwood1]CAF3384640.1 unnamed protein product [Rotaria sp. Silwood1]CAF3419615.1 unnamed protein product [Rotaria sp. Silwood1]CAF4551134.1 unnamed protein product [Rotaria sp. Silwood1]CAF4605661.1 unnamed protein product [Rotaria sp. Silwood1]
MTATNEMIPVNASYASLASRTLDCIATCGSSGGYIAPPIVPFCTDVSASVGTTVGQRLDTVSIQTGSDFAVGFNDSSWRELAQGTGAPWSIATRINLIPRSDTGFYNNAPVATMMSPVNIVKDQPTIIKIPIGDADGDDLRCRWSTSTSGIDECGGTCPPNSLPANTTIFPNCTIIITGTIVDKWYAITLMVEDFISSSSMTPLSATPVQFLVHVVAPPLCSIPPKITGVPIEQSCTPILVGQTFTSILYAKNSCGSNVTIVDIATLSYAGVLKSSITVLNETTYYKDFSWTPTAAQVGYQVVCAMAFDSQDSQSSQYCFKFYVSVLGVCVCPEHRLLVPQDLLQRVQRRQPLVPHLVQQRQLQAHRLLQQLRRRHHHHHHQQHLQQPLPRLQRLQALQRRPQQRQLQQRQQ